MSSLASVTHRCRTLLVVVVATAACSRTHPRTEASAAAADIVPLSNAERVAHVLSRLTFGARSGDAERVRRMGVDKWIDEQLRPETIPDSAVLVALAPIQTWNGPAATALAVPELARNLASKPVSMLANDSAARAMLKQITVRLVALGGLNDGFYAGKIVRAQMSERQLLEVVTDFWENHFSVYSGKMPSREAIVVWDREVLRPRALGKFRDLLGAVAHSPAMMYYLDNHLSTSRGLNENYARELMELHTLGVDGGYTQHDVVEVARALTGWTINRGSDSTTFVFRRQQHDTGAKVVLGHTLAAGRGIEDGEEVLDILARHPSTAHYIAYKLSRRLVSDDPPPAVVARAAATFTRTDGDIAQVVRTIVTSPEFFSRAAFRAKVKTPFELVVSACRALDAPADTTPGTARSIAQLGQQLFGWSTPEGWPEKGDAWMNSGTIYKRLKFGGDIAYGRVASVPLFRWRDWSALSTSSLEQQADGVVKVMLGGVAEPATREAMMALAPSRGNSDGPYDGSNRLRDVLAIALSSPEFQRR
jgi:uncharacterized protein (DUF1800 family)